MDDGNNPRRNISGWINMPKKAFSEKQFQTGRKEAQDKKRAMQDEDDPIETLSDSEGTGGTVTDSKYRRRQIQSNWEKYSPDPTLIYENDLDVFDGSKDFMTLAQSSADCNYFQLKSEKEWENEKANSSFSGNQFFNLDLEVLCRGLECIPFYERVGIDKNILSRSDVDKCDAKAKENLSRYKTIAEEFVKKLAQDSALPDEDKDTLKQHIESEDICRNENNQITYSAPGKLLVKLDMNEQDINKIEVNDKEKSRVSDVENNVKKGEENLEDWLDSVLDD